METLEIDKNEGITLIALIITIIILLILAGITIGILTRENGILNKAVQAVEETKISDYKEQIELTRTELQMQNEDYLAPTLNQMKEALDEKNWVKRIEFIIDNDIEKLKLTTQEGYIFYITQTQVEYKGKDEEKDTSALEREDVLEMKIVDTTKKGKLVQITDLTEVDYYKIKYQIGSIEGEWQDIKSGATVEVPYGEKIYAKLVYISNSGVIYHLDINHTNPVVTAKNTDTSNITRKSEEPIANLFDITWGSDGTGTVQYEITGNLMFNNTAFSSTQITNLAQLEVGNYNVKCIITTPETKYTATAIKQNIKVATLARTTVTNNSNVSVVASAIYSEYDLAYFRDLVNGGQYYINAKIMNDINLTKVCDWTPIGSIKNNITISSGTVQYINYYSGIFDGNFKNISNMRINNTVDQISLGLFGAVKNGSIKNCIMTNVNITGVSIVGSIVGYANNSNLSNCKSSGKIIGYYGIGGIAGFIENQTIIYSTKNEVQVTGYVKEGMDCCNTGGIAGVSIYNCEVKFCYNSADINSYSNSVGRYCRKNRLWWENRIFI